MTKTRFGRSAAALLLAGGSLVAGTVASPSAHAAPGDVTVNAELGPGYMLSKDQKNGWVLPDGSVQKYDKIDFQGAIHPGVVITDPLQLQLALASWWFPASAGTGRATLIGFGLRFDPEISNGGRLVLDTHGGLGLTGGVERFMFDLGLGYEFPLSDQLGIGPLLRYGQVMRDEAEDATSDAKFLSLAVSVTWRSKSTPAPAAAPPPPPPPPPPAAPKDSDGDGIPDGDDVCPTDAMGAHADSRANRKGCPAIDSDNDGVTDDVDQCPDVPTGAAADPEHAGCPDKDDDHDGVPNHQDQCPAQPAGLQPDPAKAGCPAPDKDADLVPDATDACPDKAGAPSPDPKKNGCPGLVAIQAGKIKINQQVFFATGKDTVLPKSFPLLKAVGDVLRATASIKKVRVEGHTDNKGKPETNLELSKKRAAAVRDYLVKDGIAADRLDAEGYGDSKPIAPNTDEKGRAQNRRVDFVITDPPQDAAPASAPAAPAGAAPAGAPAAPAPATPPAGGAPAAK
jgi:outer membrane protein OmpA-like peptidoglycan-associated protein